MPRLPWRKDHKLISFRRAGGTPPPDWETLDVENDGSFRMWRTIARASRPPTPIGRFGGTIPPERLAALQAAVEACKRSEPVIANPAPGAAVDSVVLGSTEASFADDQTPDPPWGELAAVLRALLGDLATSPIAAVTIESGEGRARLRHLGNTPIELDLSGAVVRAVAWEDGVAVGEWTVPVDGPRSVTAGPGWEHQLPFGHDHGPGRLVTAHVDELLAFDGDFWKACSPQTTAPAGAT